MLPPFLQKKKENERKLTGTPREQDNLLFPGSLVLWRKQAHITEFDKGNNDEKE